MSYDDKQSAKIRKSFLLQSQKMLIFTSLLQLLTPNNNLLSWYNFMVLHNLPVQGKALLWFKSLKRYVTSSDSRMINQPVCRTVIQPYYAQCNRFVKSTLR